MGTRCAAEAITAVTGVGGGVLRCCIGTCANTVGAAECITAVTGVRTTGGMARYKLITTEEGSSAYDQHQPQYGKYVLYPKSTLFFSHLCLCLHFLCLIIT